MASRPCVPHCVNTRPRGSEDLSCFVCECLSLPVKVHTVPTNSGYVVSGVLFFHLEYGSCLVSTIRNKGGSLSSGTIR